VEAQQDERIARMVAAFAAARRLIDAIKTNPKARRGLEKQARYYQARVGALAAEICRPASVGALRAEDDRQSATG
jgi:hypothetical protein